MLLSCFCSGLDCPLDLLLKAPADGQWSCRISGLSSQRWSHLLGAEAEGEEE